jgi:hypothetical protein
MKKSDLFFMLHLYQEIREVSITIPDVIVKIYLYWLLSARVISNINTKKSLVDKIYCYF